jgi:hypothetical protein
MVEKRGRPAQPGERYPCGKRRPSDYRSDTQIQRIMQDGLAFGLDPILGSQAGILCLRGHITSRQLSTADYVGSVYGRFEYYSGQKRRTRSPSYQSGAAGAPSGKQGTEADARDEFHALQDAIKIFSPEARDTLERVCVDDQHIPLNQVTDLIVLLEVIEREIRGDHEPAPALVLRPRAVKPKIEEKIEADAFVWRGEGVDGPGNAKQRESNIIDMLARLERRKEAPAS